MLQSLKSYFKEFKLVVPVEYLHLMGIGYTFGYNQEIMDIKYIVFTYIIYMIASIPVSFLMTIIIKGIIGVWNKIL